MCDLFNSIYILDAPDYNQWLRAIVPNREQRQHTCLTLLLARVYIAHTCVTHVHTQVDSYPCAQTTPIGI